MPEKNPYYFLLLKKRVAQKVRNNDNADLPLTTEEKKALIEQKILLESRTLDTIFSKTEMPNFREDTFDLLAKYVGYEHFNDFRAKNNSAFAENLGEKPIHAFEAEKQKEIRAEVEKTLFPQKDVKKDDFQHQVFNHAVFNDAQSDGDYNQVLQNIENSQISITNNFYGENSKKESEKVEFTPENVVLPERLSDYLINVISHFEKWQVFFVHILGRQVAEINRVAREVNAIQNVREGTVEELRYLISQNEKRMMILGQPGMGKSTSMQYLVQKDAQKLLQNDSMPNLENRVPMYLELRFVTNSIFDLIFEELSPYFGVTQDTSSLIDKMLRKGLFFIFLDGLNETIKDKSGNILKEIQTFYKKYPNCVYIISSRPETYIQQATGQIPVFNLEAMNKEQQKEFLIKNTSEKIEKTITNTLANFPDLEDFLGVPLLLFMLIRVVEQTNEVPKNKNQIIKTFLEGIYLLEKQKNSNFDSYQIDILLADLAEQYFEFYGGNAKLPYPKVTEYLSAKIRAEKFNLNPLEVLKKMVELQILDFSQEKYAFKHQLFLDYFVLKYDIDFEF
jgi:hypothetical protein